MSGQIQPETVQFAPATALHRAICTIDYGHAIRCKSCNYFDIALYRLTAMNTTLKSHTHRRLLLASFPSDAQAKKVLKMALEHNMAPDRISLLGRTESSGDDPLGVYYPSLGERMLGWGRMGAVWGGIWGLVSGALGMFLIPGLGPVMVAGPVVEALIGALGGAGIGGGALAGAAALSQIGTAVHRMGVPSETLEQVHGLLEDGHYLFMLIVDADEQEHWRDRLAVYHPEFIADYPYLGITDALRESV
jgi:hypothetical protein